MNLTDRDHPGDDYPPPSSVHIAGKAVRVGDLVRLHPTARADAFDMLLEGKVARIVKVEQDFENRVYLVVTVNDDPVSYLSSLLSLLYDYTMVSALSHPGLPKPQLLCLLFVYARSKHSPALHDAPATSRLLPQMSEMMQNAQDA